jgi:hypothetical protein
LSSPKAPVFQRPASDWIATIAHSIDAPIPTDPPRFEFVDRRLSQCRIRLYYRSGGGRVDGVFMQPSSSFLLAALGLAMLLPCFDEARAAPSSSLSRGMLPWHFRPVPAGIRRNVRIPSSHEGRLAASASDARDGRRGSHGETYPGDGPDGFEDVPPDIAADYPDAPPPEEAPPHAGSLHVISEDEPAPIDMLMRTTARPQILVLRASPRSKRHLPVVIYGSVTVEPPR